jgi:CubicO group peptidase (beta-lactamase class C family)
VRFDSRPAAFRSFVWFSLAIAPAISSSQAGPAPAEDAHIHQIETGLLPTVLIKGEPAPEKSLSRRMLELHVPGVSIAFFENGHVVWAKAYGYADVANKRLLTTDTLLQAGSISKPLSAITALQLVEKGKLDLDRDVNTELKAWRIPPNAFTAVQKVTLRRLLSHTAGLTVHGFDGYARGDTLPTLPQILNGQKPANSAPVVVNITPGTKYIYSGGGYVVAQLLMEETTGAPFASLMRDNVLRPLQMTHSTYEQPLPSSSWESASLGYDMTGNPIKGGWHVYPEQTAAGLWTTPSDLALLAIELQNDYAGASGGLLTPAMAHTMLTPVLDGYGLGMDVPTSGTLRFGHGGANAGFEALLFAYTGGSRQGVAIMTNGDQGDKLASEIRCAVAKAYSWPEYLPKVLNVVSVDEHVLQTYVGHYVIDSNREFDVTTDSRTLFVFGAPFGPAPVAAKFSSPTDFFSLDPEFSGKFVKGADGTKTSIVFGGGSVANRVAPQK